jgi:putative DNA primase/helicase
MDTHDREVDPESSTDKGQPEGTGEGVLGLEADPDPETGHLADVRMLPVPTLGTGSSVGGGTSSACDAKSSMLRRGSADVSGSRTVGTEDGVESVSPTSPGDADRLLVEPPNDPMANARLFVKDCYTQDTDLLLRSHGGIRRSWSGSSWPELAMEELTAGIYLYFEDADYASVTDDGVVFVPFLPNKRKVGDVSAAIDAVIHLSDRRSMPFWIDRGVSPVDVVPPKALVPMANGLLRVDTRTLIRPTPNFFCPYSLPYDYDPDAPPPKRFLVFLNELWADDQESKDLLQEFIGYLLVPDTSQQKMLLLVGPPRSGKGTISRMIRDLVGHHNVAGPTLSGLATNFGLQPMIDKPVAIISDARLSGRKDNAIVVERLLSISGEDALTVDRKHKSAWTGPLPSRIVIITNELPRLDDASGALASRFVVLQMTESFLGKEEHDLSAKLAEELPGILLWALDGLKRLRERGHFKPPERSSEVVRELADLSSPMRAFVRDCCVVESLRSVGVGDVFDEWKRWCEDTGASVGTKQTFGRNLRSVVPNLETNQERFHGVRQRRYKGIGLARDGTRS